MKQIQSQLNHQLLGRIPNQMSKIHYYQGSSYRKINGYIMAFQNKLSLSKDQENYDLKILSPGFMKSNRQTSMFNWKVNLASCELLKFTQEEFYHIYLYNCFLLGDFYKANSLQYIQSKYRSLDSYFDQDSENRNNLLLLGDNMENFNNFKLQNTEQEGFAGYQKIYVNKKNAFVTFSVYDIIKSTDNSLRFFQKLVEQDSFNTIEEALSYYGVTFEEINQLNIHQLFSNSKLATGNMQFYRQNYQEDYQDIAFCAYTLHINQFHRNVPGNVFSQNECEQCNSNDPSQYCTSLKPVTPLKQPQLIPLCFLQQYPLNYKIYDLICILYHSLICQFKIWNFQDSVERILNYEITDEALLTSQSNSGRNYENLELLGDSVLKYVVTVDIFDHYEQLDEGEMTSLRSRLIMNTFLADLFEQSGLEHYVINYDLHFKQVRNPLVNDIKPNESQTLQLSQKADIYEAIIGGVFEKSQSLYEYITVLRRVKFPISFKQNIFYDFQQIDDNLQALNYQDYKFKNPQLLQIALNPNQYDRLEFLGDAALELLAVAYLFKVARRKQQENPKFKLNPGILSNWKQELLGNKFMGEQTIKMGLLPKIEEFPKLYGDVFESLAAAILIDGGWENLNKVFGSIYKQEIDNKFV